jgi:beta-galactosidase/beta-glucuronidase
MHLYVYVSVYVSVYVCGSCCLLLLCAAGVHHDNGPLGARAIARADERRVELLKQSGYNAVRTAHNPPSQAFVDACNRLGLVLMLEAFDTWHEGTAHTRHPAARVH